MAAVAPPAVLVFDVNETLVDIEVLEPYFTTLFGQTGVLREWFGQLVMYSMAVTLSNCYTDFFSLGRATLQMLAEAHGVALSNGDAAAVTEAMATMPAHPDAAEGLSRLRDDGYRLVALTNSPARPERPTAVDNAGLAGYFERQFSVDELRVFKPSTVLYQHTAHELGVQHSACMMVAAHAWDIIGAQAAGFSGALLTRPGNAPLRVEEFHQPDFIAADLVDLARQLAQTFEK
jgi:2-haloacid dehalogenase